jgi:hypothetical protein
MYLLVLLLLMKIPLFMGRGIFIAVAPVLGG